MPEIISRPLRVFRGKDILLLLLYFPGKSGEGIVGSTRLMKAMFLFEKEIRKPFKASLEDFPQFVPWDYGPWSEDVLDYIGFFEGIGFVRTSDSQRTLSHAEQLGLARWASDLPELSDEELKGTQYDIHETSFHLTGVGKKYVEDKLSPRLTEAQKNILGQFKEKISSLSLFSLLRYVYNRYGDDADGWTSRSKIRERITRRARV